MKNTDVNPFTAMLGHRHSENDKSAKFEIIQSFLLLGMSHERISVKMHSTASWFVIGPSNILYYRCVHVPASAWKFYRLGSEGVKS